MRRLASLAITALYFAALVAAIAVACLAPVLSVAG